MRVAHAHERQPEVHPVDRQREVYHRTAAFDVRGQAGRIEVGRTHVHPGSRHDPVLPEELERLDAGERLHRDAFAIGGHEPLFDGELHHAADAVAAHLSLGAVCVEHAHAHVGDLRGQGQD